MAMKFFDHRFATRLTDEEHVKPLNLEIEMQYRQFTLNGSTREYLANIDLNDGEDYDDSDYAGSLQEGSRSIPNPPRPSRRTHFTTPFCLPDWHGNQRQRLYLHSRHSPIVY